MNAHRADRDAIDVVYRSLQHDREQADIRDIIRRLHQVVDEAIDLQADRTGDEDPTPYDISAIDFDRLKREFERSREKRTTVQALKHAVEQRLQRLLARNPLRTDFQQHYEEIVAEYNREKDRVTIERTFEELLKFVQELEQEESRALREGLDEESLAIFDLLNKPDLGRTDIERIKKVAQGAAADAQGREAPCRPVARQGGDPERRKDRHPRLPLQPTRLACLPTPTPTRT